MKRILSTLLMLSMVMAAMAEEKLYVAGEQLNLSKTYSQVYLDALGGGYFDYYPSAKRLILTGVTIERSGDGRNGIDSSVAGLRIEFVGINSIKTSAACLKLQSNTTLVNEGTVKLTCTGSNEGIYIMNTSTVTIQGGTWKIQASSGTGIEGKDKNQTVYIYDDENCPLYLTVNGKNGCILDLKYLYVGKGIDVCEPVRDKLNQNYIESFNTGIKRFSTALYNVGTTNSIKNRDVVIGTPAFELGGHGFTTNTTSIIASTITGVTYDKSTKTLKMVNAQINEGYFRPYLDDMKIEINGTRNTLNYYGDHSCIISDKLLTINGNGTLTTGPITLNTNGYLHIRNGATINIINAKNTKPGIDGVGVVFVDNTTLNIDVQSEAVCCSTKIELLGSIISSPSNAILADKTKVEGYNFYTVNKDGEGCYIIDKDLNDIKDQLSIVKGTAYDLWVGGVRVNSANKNNLNNGSCSYNTSTKTLLLNNAKISLTNGFFASDAIDNGIDGLTIQNQGTSELSSNKGNGIFSNKAFTIKGNGHLKVTTGGSTSSAIYYDGSSNGYMTISDIELTATGGEYAILGNTDVNTGKVSVVDVTNSTLHLYGSSKAIDVTSFDPNGNCYITTPSGGINAITTITNASGTPAKKVEIEPKKGIVTAIEAVTPIEEVGETSIYTPSGILVWKGTGQPQLPSGIYMIKKNGKTKKVQF